MRRLPGLQVASEVCRPLGNDPGAFASRMGAPHLLLRAQNRVESLPPELSADIAALLGIHLRRQEVIEHSLDGLLDQQWVLGVRRRIQDGLIARRTWLLGQGSGRLGYILDFAPSADRLPPALPLDVSLEARVVFHPSTVPQRCILGTEVAEQYEEGRTVVEVGDALAPFVKPLPLVWQG